MQIISDFMETRRTVVLGAVVKLDKSECGCKRGHGSDNKGHEMILLEAKHQLVVGDLVAWNQKAGTGFAKLVRFGITAVSFFLVLLQQISQGMSLVLGNYMNKY